MEQANKNDNLDNKKEAKYIFFKIADWTTIIASIIIILGGSAFLFRNFVLQEKFPSSSFSKKIMPLNLLKKYNQLLDIASMTEYQCKKSLRGIFDRDITNNPNFKFQTKQINPTPVTVKIQWNGFLRI